MQTKHLATPAFYPSRRIVARAMRIPPERLVAATQPRFIYDMPELATEYVIAQSLANTDVESDRALERYLEEIYHAGTLAATLEDTLHVFDYALGNYKAASPNSQLDEVIRIARHPQTGRTFAKLALLPSPADNKNNLLQRLPPEAYWVDPQEGCLRTDVTVDTVTARTCPFAGFNSEAKIDPIFVKYTRWAGEVAVRTCHATSNRNKMS